MLENLDKKKIMAIIAISILLIGGCIYYFLQDNQEDEYQNFEGELEVDHQNILEENNVIEQKAKIIIDISGQVVSPGVIALEEGARIIDAINAAGGATKDANLAKVNLAYLLEDAQKIYIPSVNDKNDTAYVSEGSGDEEIITNENTQKSSNKKEEKLMININTANEGELQKLPGIGSSIASRIVTYRKENGKFNTIEDIKNVSGIGDSKFNNIKNNIYVK